MNDANRRVGGAFTDRPKRRTVGKVPVIWHDLGLSLVYASSLAAWAYLLFDGILRPGSTGGLRPSWGPWTASDAVWCILFIVLMYLARCNDDESTRIAAWIDTQPVGSSKRQPNSALQSGGAKTAPPLNA